MKIGKNGNLGKKLESWRKLGNLETIWKFVKKKRGRKLGGKLEILNKNLEVRKKMWKFQGGNWNFIIG